MNVIPLRLTVPVQVSKFLPRTDRANNYLSDSSLATL